MNISEKKRAVIFDMDGTIWDSSLQVTESWILALQKVLPEKSFTKEEIQGCMGMVMNDIFDALLCAYPLECRRKVQKACEEFENVYLEEHPGKIYDGLIAAVNALHQKGYMVLIVTNAQDGYVQSFLKSSHLEKLFDDYEMYGRTGLLKAENIYLIMQRNKINKAVYIGDTELDYKSALSANCSFIHAAYGFGEIAEPCLKANTPFDIPKLVEKIFIE